MGEVKAEFDVARNRDLLGIRKGYAGMGEYGGSVWKERMMENIQYSWKQQ